jgi:hypothetical protein
MVYYPAPLGGEGSGAAAALISGFHLDSSHPMNQPQENDPPGLRITGDLGPTYGLIPPDFHAAALR